MKQLFLLFSPLILLAQSYTFSGADENVVQIMAGKILTKAYKDINIDIETVFVQAEASLQSSNNGERDGELARIKTIDTLYPNLSLVPVPLVKVEAIAFSRKRYIDIKEWEDLKSYRLVIVRGTKFIEKATKGISKRYTDTFKEAFDKLNAQETDVVVIPNKAAIRLMLRDEYCHIHAVSGVLKGLDLYHFVHKKNKHLIPLITPVLKKMKESGEIAYIQKSYLRSLTSSY